jgi:hypothetical protein
MQLIE